VYVTDVGSHSWHHTLALRTTKGDEPTVVALAPPTKQAVAAAIDGRISGPLLLNRHRRRMTSYNVCYLVAALVRDAGIGKHLTPHGLRHSAITIGLDAGDRGASTGARTGQESDGSDRIRPAQGHRALRHRRAREGAHDEQDAGAARVRSPTSDRR
jgi:integrase